MKKLMSILVAITIVVGMAVPTFAATPKKYADCTTNTERIQYFKDTYGFTEIYDMWGVKNGEWYEDTAGTAKVLDLSQSGFSLVGSSTTKKILAEFDKCTLSLSSSEAFPGKNAAFGGGDFMIKENASVRSVVHETMHAFDFGMLKDSGASTVAKINSSYSGYTNANQYASQTAALNSAEDFADTCAIMIVNGGNTPCTVSKDTILYKKYKACYDLMVEHLGVKSNAVKRSAAFLGIELPKE